MTTIDAVIDDALRQADALFDGYLRAAQTRLLTGGGDAEVDLDALDARLDDARREWAIERAKLPGVIQRALGAGR